MVVGAAEFLAVTRDQQQRVVGARAEHQHTGDPGGRPVRLHAECVGHRGAQHRRDSVGEADDQQRHQPQHR